MKKRLLEAINVLVWFLFGLICAGLIGLIFPLWGIIYILTGFNYYEFMLDVLDDLP